MTLHVIIAIQITGVMHFYTCLLVVRQSTPVIKMTGHPHAYRSITNYKEGRLFQLHNKNLNLAIYMTHSSHHCMLIMIAIIDI